MPRIPGLDELQNQDRLLSDIASKLDRIASSANDYRKNVHAAVEDSRDLTSQLDTQVKLFQTNLSQGIYSQQNVDQIAKLSREMDKLEQKARKLVGVQERLAAGFDKVGKGLLKMTGSAVTRGIDLLIEGIQRVYDLEERWARVTGEVNQRLGKLSPHMRSFWKESRQAESAIRGLGGELGEGTKMFAEFTAGFNKMDTLGFGKLGIQLAQGFDVGAESAGKLLRTLSNIGFDERQKEASELMKSITVGAKTADVSVNALAKDFAESATFVARFGKEGTKALVKSAAYLKQFNVSLRDTEKLMDKFDTFDSAADSVAKLNVVFGTSINALDTMLEQDPAKRFEQIRQAMMGQGKTWERLTYFERKAFVSTTGLTEDQAAAMLDVRNAGKSYSQFLAENERNQRKAGDAQKMMQQQLQATAKTLYNFGAAADRITVAIANVIKPFTDMLGLTKSSDKQWKSFSQVMESVTQTVIRFFNTLAKNSQWKDFMQKAADLTKKFAGYVADFFSPSKIGRNIDMVVSGLKTFAKVSAGIIALWAGSKIFSGVSGAVGLVKQIGELRGTFGAGAGARSMVTSVFPGAATSKGRLLSSMGSSAGGGGMIGRAGLGGAVGGLAGAGIGHLFGATTGGGIGGGIGGAIGSFFGPIGTVIGAAVGTGIGIGVEKLLDTPEAKRVREAMDKLSKSQLNLDVASAQLEVDQLKYKDVLDSLSQSTRDYLDSLVDTASVEKARAESKAAEAQIEAQVKLAELEKRRADENTNWYDFAPRVVGKALDKVGLASENMKVNLKQFQDARTASTEAEKKLQDLQTKKIDLDRQDLELQLKSVEQQRAKLQLGVLLEQGGFKAALEASKGDVASAVEDYNRRYGGVSKELMDLVRPQARSAKQVGPVPSMEFAPEDVARSSGSGGGRDVVVTVPVHLDNKEIARGQARVALTNGH